jgi:DNA-binding response OmpR family regulator
MADQKKALVIGDSSNVRPFLPAFKNFNVEVKVLSDVRLAIDLSKEFKPHAIVFITPLYWENVLDFVKEIREVEGFSETLIVYIGSLVEGGDQIILRENGVKTFTLGPVPHPEMVRFIVDQMPYF